VALLQVRDFPDELYAILSMVAKRENRSITQETITLLQAALGQSGGRRERRKRTLADIAALELGDTSAFPDPASLIREDRDR